MARLFELLCYYSLEHSDPTMDEIFTFINSTLSSLSFTPAISTVLPEATDGNLNEFQILQRVPLTVFGMCSSNTTEYFPRRGLVEA